MTINIYSKTCLKRPLKKNTKIWFLRLVIAKCRSKVLQNAQREHSAILSTFIEPPFVFKTFILSIYEWPFKTCFTVQQPILIRLTHSHAVRFPMKSPMPSSSYF